MTLDERAEALCKTIFSNIEHGDESHRVWLNVTLRNCSEIKLALLAVVEACAEVCAKYEDACIMGELAHGSKAATKHGRAVARFIAQQIRQEVGQ